MPAHMPSVQPLVGEAISQVWFSDYAICYLELGMLKAGRELPNGRIGTPRGEFTVFLGYDWKVQSEGVDRTRLDYHANDVELASLVAKLEGAVIRSVELSATDSEIKMCLSNGVNIFTVSANGEAPSWNIRVDKQVSGYLCIKDQELVFEPSRP